jgi:hypothetical protein
MSKPNCTQCKHFYITWDPKIPNGCKQFGIMCKDLPSKIVAQAGMGECSGFEAKKRPEQKSDKLDLNRRDLW